MNPHHIPLATASLLFAIARPAMAASGTTFPSSIGQAGPVIMLFGLGLIALEILLLRSQGIRTEDNEGKQILSESKTAQTGKVLFVLGLFLWLLSLVFLG